jgi:hypothetical protein
VRWTDSAVSWSLPKGGLPTPLPSDKPKPQCRLEKRGDAAPSLEIFHQRLRDLCPHHLPGFGDARSAAIQEQAKQAVLLADEYGILRRPAETAAEFDASGEKAFVSGTEHWVDFDDTKRLVIKITRPPGFGLIPYVRSSRIIDLRNPGAAPVMKETVEFTVATPLEYLERWLDANELFSDVVRLVSVIQWGEWSSVV